MIIRILNSMKKDRNHKKGPVRNKEYTSEINNTLEGINCRLEEVEDQISNLENKIEKTPKQSSCTWRVSRDKRKKNPLQIDRWQV